MKCKAPLGLHATEQSAVSSSNYFISNQLKNKYHYQISTKKVKLGLFNRTLYTGDNGTAFVKYMIGW